MIFEENYKEEIEENLPGLIVQQSIFSKTLLDKKKEFQKQQNCENYDFYTEDGLLKIKNFLYLEHLDESTEKTLNDPQKLRKISDKQEFLIENKYFDPCKYFGQDLNFDHEVLKSKIFQKQSCSRKGSKSNLRSNQVPKQPKILQNSKRCISVSPKNQIQVLTSFQNTPHKQNQSSLFGNQTKKIKQVVSSQLTPKSQQQQQFRLDRSLSPRYANLKLSEDVLVVKQQEIQSTISPQSKVSYQTFKDIFQDKLQKNNQQQDTSPHSQSKEYSYQQQSSFQKSQNNLNQNQGSYINQNFTKINLSVEQVNQSQSLKKSQNNKNSNNENIYGDMHNVPSFLRLKQKNILKQQQNLQRSIGYQQEKNKQSQSIISSNSKNVSQYLKQGETNLIKLNENQKENEILLNQQDSIQQQPQQNPQFQNYSQNNQNQYSQINQQQQQFLFQQYNYNLRSQSKQENSIELVQNYSRPNELSINLDNSIPNQQNTTNNQANYNLEEYQIQQLNFGNNRSNKRISSSIQNSCQINSHREINSQNDVIPKRYISIPQLFLQGNSLSQTMHLQQNSDQKDSYAQISDRSMQPKQKPSLKIDLSNTISQIEINNRSAINQLNQNINQISQTTSKIQAPNQSPQNYLNFINNGNKGTNNKPNQEGLSPIQKENKNKLFSSSKQNSQNLQNTLILHNPKLIEDSNKVDSNSIRYAVKNQSQTNLKIKQKTDNLFQTIQNQQILKNSGTKQNFFNNENSSKIKQNKKNDQLVKNHIEPKYLKLFNELNKLNKRYCGNFQI